MFKFDNNISGITESVGFVEDKVNTPERYITIYKLDDNIGDDIFERGHYIRFVEEFINDKVNPNFEYVHLSIEDVDGEDVIIPTFVIVDDIVQLEPVAAYEFLSKDFDNKYLTNANEETLLEVEKTRDKIKEELRQLNRILKDDIEDYGFVRKEKKLTEDAKYPHPNIDVYVENGEKKASLYYGDLTVYFWKPNSDYRNGPLGEYIEDDEYDVEYEYVVDYDDLLSVVGDIMDWEAVFGDTEIPDDDDEFYAMLDDNIDKLLNMYESKIMDAYKEDATQEAQEKFDKEDLDDYYYRW